MVPPSLFHVKFPVLAPQKASDSQSQSHYIEAAQGAIFMEKYEIWADFEPVGNNTEKKVLGRL